MAIVPLLMNLAREMESDWDHHYMDDDFGFGIHPMDLFGAGPSRLHHSGAMMLHPRRRYNPYDQRSHALLRRAASRGGKMDDAASMLLPTVGKDGQFQVLMDVSQFKPNELTVKTVDKTIVVEGKHEEREDDHGMIQRHFVRKYTLPKDYDPHAVVSTVSSDGVLTVRAPPPPSKALKQNERIVQIQQTGPAHLSVKQPEHEKDGASSSEAGGKGAVKQHSHNGAQTPKAGSK